MRRSLSMLASTSSRVLLGALLLTHSLSSAAQSRHEGDYRVELIVFAQSQSTAEQFPDNIRLSYPNRLEQLQLTPIDSSALDQSTLGTSAPTAPQNVATPSSTNQYYLALPRAEQQLASEVRKLDNHGYRVLFHQAWVQPVSAARSSRNLAIFGGREFSDHYELEGSINISVATYLRLSTNLWLSEFSESDAAAPSKFELPPLPRPAKSLEQLEQEASLDNLLGELATDSATPDATAITHPEEDAITAPPLHVTQVYLMQQSRDLRSNEIHYLDHPRVGVIVKISPVEKPKAP